MATTGAEVIAAAGDDAARFDASVVVGSSLRFPCGLISVPKGFPSLYFALFMKSDYLWTLIKGT